MKYLHILAGVSDGTLARWNVAIICEKCSIMHHLTCYKVPSSFTCNEYRWYYGMVPYMVLWDTGH